MGAGVRRCLMQAYNDLIRLCDAAGTRENVFEVIDAMEANKIQLDMDTMQVSKDVEMFCSAVGESLPSFVTCSLSGIRLCCGSASPCPVAHGPIRRRGPTGNARSDPGAPSPVRTGDAHAFGPPPNHHATRAVLSRCRPSRRFLRSVPRGLSARRRWRAETNPRTPSPGPRDGTGAFSPPPAIGARCCYPGDKERRRLVGLCHRARYRSKSAIQDCKATAVLHRRFFYLYYYYIVFRCTRV